MTQAEVETALQTFISTEILDNDASGLNAQTPLLELGIVDTYSMIRVVHFIFTQFGVSVPNEDLMNPDIFSSIQAIAGHVMKVQK